MLQKKKRILHGMSDIAGQGTYSVKGLVDKGEKASLFVWRQNIFHYSDCTCLNIGTNKLFYPLYAIKMFCFGMYAMFQYDVFHFHFGDSLFPFGLDWFLLKKLKKTVIMEYHGGDIRWVFYRKKPEYFYQPELPLISDRTKNRILRTFRSVDQFILHDCELVKHFPERKKDIFFVPLRIDTKKFKPIYPSVFCNKPILVHAPSNSLHKGSKYIIDAVKRLKEKYDFEFILVEKKTQEEAIQIYKKADIIVDQLFAGTYGVFSLEAMALGKPVIAYITDKMRRQFPEELPIQNATIHTIEFIIEKLLLDPKLRYELGVKGRKYIENYHDYKYIAKELCSIYENKENTCSQKEAFERIRKWKEEDKDVYRKRKTENKQKIF